MEPTNKVYVYETRGDNSKTLRDVSYVRLPEYDEFVRKDAILEYLDKWMDHAVRGMQKGATAYHQGKVALITDMRDWLNMEDER